MLFVFRSVSLTAHFSFRSGHHDFQLSRSGCIDCREGPFLPYVLHVSLLAIHLFTCLLIAGVNWGGYAVPLSCIKDICDRFGTPSQPAPASVASVHKKAKRRSVAIVIDLTRSGDQEPPAGDKDIRQAIVDALANHFRMYTTKSYELASFLAVCVRSEGACIGGRITWCVSAAVLDFC